ncbi:MAG: BNR-4 repeat-containing protein, partial [Promethearchaeota archaeon]
MDYRKLKKLDGFNGIWYCNQPVNTVHRYKYSGGLATYCAKHIPMTVHVPTQRKTFFVYGGIQGKGNTLVHALSYFDHETSTCARPRCVLD